mmetsp:Transcript_34550/g.64516  ORF Transcript_34550/g.64516 Transcript_34550/m.64516 type:complete len:573 (-) Transcript_34550:28-1746(-)
MLGQFLFFFQCSALLQACSSGPRCVGAGTHSLTVRDTVPAESNELSMLQRKARANVASASDAPTMKNLQLVQKMTPQDTQAERPEGSDCNLCNDDSQQWVFILSPGGRTGSSTIVTMLNSIPGFYIAGENDGIIDDMLSFYNKTFIEEDVEGTTGSDANQDPISEYNVLCSLQSIVRASLGGSPDKQAVLGFKEIRIHKKEQLDFLKRVFPCARFIVNVRQNMTALFESQIVAYEEYVLNPEDTAQQAQSNDMKRSELEGWAKAQGDNVFQMPLEDFSLNRFNVLLRWLGVSNCAFQQVAHANDNQWYSKTLDKVPMYQKCGIHGFPGGKVNIAEIFFFPQKNVVTCACSKCGSTSMYKFVYKSLFGKDWQWWNWPWPQEDTKDPDRWEGQRQSIDATSALALMDKREVFSFTLVRDPQERLISSWKSKVSCDESCWKTDVTDRARLVPELLATVGNLSKVSCLSFDDFVETLHQAHSQGKAGILNRHFIPQHLDCFLDIPKGKWSKVVKVEDSDAARDLGAQFGNMSASSFPRIHGSHMNCSFPPPAHATAKKLEAITKAEYLALGLKPPA